jgi:undecaprenyl-diphosphatase
MKRETAARFSFYLSAPIIAGAVAKKMLDIFKAGIPADQVSAFVIGVVVSGIVGYLSIAFLLGYLKTHNTFLFVYYRIALAIVVFLAFWFGFR